MDSLDSGYRSFQNGTCYVSHVLSRWWLDAVIWLVVRKQIYYDILIFFKRHALPFHSRNSNACFLRSPDIYRGLGSEMGVSISSFRVACCELTTPSSSMSCPNSYANLTEKRNIQRQNLPLLTPEKLPSYLYVCPMQKQAH